MLDDIHIPHAGQDVLDFEDEQSYELEAAEGTQVTRMTLEPKKFLTSRFLPQKVAG